MRRLGRLLHWFYLGRATSRGLSYFAGYEERRQARRCGG